MSIKLNDKQQNIVTAILDFIFYSNEKYLNIDSIAGSGKSTIINEVNNNYQNIVSTTELLTDEVIPDIIYTATSHPAVTQLQTMGCKPVATIHSTLNLQVKYNYGTSELVQRTKPKLNPRTVIIIDESSFIDSELQYYIDRCKCRFILIGDADQFLGVNNDTGKPIHFNGKTYSLMDSFRFKDKELADYVLRLKTNVSNRVIEPLPNSVGDSLFMTDDDTFLATLTDAYKQAANDSLVITFTNKNVAAYEKGIRRILNLPSTLATGDSLVLKSDMRRTLGFRISPNGGKAVTDIEVINDSSFIPTKAGALLNKAGIKYTAITSSKGGIGYIVDDITCVNKLMNSFKKDKLWQDYYTIKHNVSVANYGYASTAYGAQGLTIPYVFIDLTDLSSISHVLSKDTIARLIYVSISRTSKICFIRGEIPHWLIGSY